MNLIHLRGKLINLNSANHIQKIYPGYKDWTGTHLITVNEYQIRFYFGDEDYMYVAYGKQESQWRDDWDWLNSFTIERSATPPRSPDGSGQ